MRNCMLKEIISSLFLGLIVLFSAQAIAQEEILKCGTTFEGEPLVFAQNKLAQARAMMNENEEFVFKVRINYVDGVVADEEKETKALDIVGVLNLYFNDSNFFFKYGGYITRTGLSTTYNSTMSSTYNNLCDDEYIEIFIVNTIPGASGVTNTVFFQQNNAYGRFIVLRNSSIPLFNTLTPTSYEVLVHEMGHYFGLHHTWQRWYNFNDGNIAYAPDDECMRNYATVTYYPLNENLDGSQWNLRGDLIQDTEPDRHLIKYKKTGSSLSLSYNVVNCSLNQNNGLASTTLSSSCTTPVDTIDLSVFSPNLQNFMAYYAHPNNSSNCQYVFTSGQVERMISVINFVPFLNNKRIDPIELYIPFRSDVVPSTNNTWTEINPDNPDVIRICSWYTRRYKYQKGFNYEFINNNNQVVSTHPVYEAPYVGNVNLKINQLGDDVVSLWGLVPDHWFYIPHGSHCYDAPVTGGRHTKLPVLGGMQMEVTNLNKDQATDPELINNLESGKYHIIEKETETGEKTTQTIYKTE